MCEVRGGGWEEVPPARGQGQWPRVPGCDSTGTVERSYPMPEARDSSQEELPHARGRGCRQDEQPHVQGAVAAQAQESLEELLHVQVQGGWR